MKLEEFNKLCDAMLKECHIDMIFKESDPTANCTIIVLCDLVSVIKEFSNSEKGIADIGKIHKVCRNMFMVKFNKCIDSIDLKILSSVNRVVFEFVTSEVPSIYAVLRPNNSVYSMTNPIMWNGENDSKKSAVSSILSALDLFESYILVKYVDMGGDIIIGRKKKR